MNAIRGFLLWLLDAITPVNSKSVSISDTDTVEKVERVPVHVYSKEHLQELKQLFPESDWKRITNAEDLRRLQGQHDVIDSIENRMIREARKVEL